MVAKTGAATPPIHGFVDARGRNWWCAAFVCAAGLLVSFKLDLPTGPLIICMFGVALSLAGVVSRWYPMPEVS